MADPSGYRVEQYEVSRLAGRVAPLHTAIYLRSVNVQRLASPPQSLRRARNTKSRNLLACTVQIEFSLCLQETHVPTLSWYQTFRYIPFHKRSYDVFLGLCDLQCMHIHIMGTRGISRALQSLITVSFPLFDVLTMTRPFRKLNP